MKLLVDMNLSPTWAEFLASNGHEAVHWLDVGNPDATDREILEWCRTHEHIVLTHDLDFAVIIAHTSGTGPSVIQIRYHAPVPQIIGQSIVGVLEAHSTQLVDGAIASVSESATRVRVLPIR